MAKVEIEVLPWLSQAFGGESGERLVLGWELGAGQTLLGLLQDLACHFPEAGKVLLPSSTAAEYVCLLLNGRLVGTGEWTAIEVRDKDSITLLPAFSGG